MVQMFRLIVCGLVLATVATAGGQDDAPKKKRGNAKHRQGGAMLLKKLEAAALTEDQMAKVKELVATMQTEMKAVKEEGCRYGVLSPEPVPPFVPRRT